MTNIAWAVEAVTACSHGAPRKIKQRLFGNPSLSLKKDTSTSIVRIDDAIAHLKADGKVVNAISLALRGRWPQ